MCSKMRMLILLLGLIIFGYSGYVIALEPCNLDPNVPPGSDTEWTLRVYLVGDTSGPAEHWYNGYANFEVNPSGGPVDALYAINAAASTWNGASWNGISGDFIFYYMGTTNRLAGWDFHNVVCFDWFEDDYGNHPPGHTLKWFAWLHPERIIEADTILNRYVSWTAGYDVQNVATHEFGHWLELHDLYGPCSEFEDFTMWYGTWPGDLSKITLEYADRWGKWEIYSSGRWPRAPVMNPDSDSAMATIVKLEAIFPSPANPDAWIPYKLSKSADVKISIYNAAGQLVRVLNLGTKAAGQYLKKAKAAYWDGRNKAGERVSSGVYFCVIQADGFSDAKKMVVSK